MKDTYIITMILNNNEVIERTTYDTEEELKERIDCYKKNNIKIIKIVKECIQKIYINIEF